MRNLKRTLSLVLAALMLMGMMVVGAGAAGVDDFSDKDEIVNKDAVSMLTILGVINGKEDGSYYAPKDNVTRAEMAKMIATILNQGADVNDLYANLETGLTDIDNSWAKGYINYCYSLGIIAGRGNGTFDPTAPVTGNEAAKMLLVAIGYDPEVEGLTGASWAIKTTSLASTLGIFDDLTAPTAENLNRDNAALLIYNALDVEMIQKYEDGYAMIFEDHRTLLSNKYGVYKVEGIVTANEWAELNQTNSEATAKTGKTTLDHVKVYASTTSNTTVAEYVEEKEPVTFNVSTDVSMLGKAVTMYIKKTTVLANSTVLGVTVDDKVNVIEGTVANSSKVTDLLKGTGLSVTDDTEYYVNYGYESASKAAELISDFDWDTNTSKFNVNGVDVKLIDNNNDGDVEYVLYIRETLSNVVRTSTKDETVTINVPVVNGNGLLAKNNNTTTTTQVLDNADVVTSMDLAADDLILYVQYGGRTYITEPTIVTGTMTRVDRDQAEELYITVDDGETYKMSYIREVESQVDADITRFYIENAGKSNGAKFDTKYDFILDSNGYIVAFRPAEDVVTNYGLVLESAWTQNALDYSGQVKILRADAVEQTYTINWSASDDCFRNGSSDLEKYLGTRDVNNEVGIGANTLGAAVGTVIEYSVDADGILTIENVLNLNWLDGQGNLVDNADKDIDNITADWDKEDIAYIAKNQKAENSGILTNKVTPNLQYTLTDKYETGDGYLNVSAKGYSKVFAVDKNTVAFYYVDSKHYGVATGWENMGDVNKDVKAQIYPVITKSGGEYRASELADVVLFNAELTTNTANYMLVLNANAIDSKNLELNVVFEDGTTSKVIVSKSDYGSDFDSDDDFMKAYKYGVDGNGKYTINTNKDDVISAVPASLLQNGTVEAGYGKYLTIVGNTNVWDVTDVDSADDEVTTGSFDYVNDKWAVIVETNNNKTIKTAWVWDMDGDSSYSSCNFDWNLSNYKTIWATNSIFDYIQMAEAFDAGMNVKLIGNVDLTKSDYSITIPAGLTVQIEGNLTTGNNNNVLGDGSLRVKGIYNAYEDIRVATQASYLNIKHPLTIYANTHVQNDIAFDSSTTVWNGVHVCANGKMVVATPLTIYGHVQATNATVNAPVYVYSDKTLLIFNNLEINAPSGAVYVGGTVGTTTYAGALTMGGSGAITGTGDLVVNNGTLTLSSASNVNMESGSDFTVRYGGTVEQKYVSNNVNKTLTAGNITLSGKVSLPGNVSALNSLNITSTAIGGSIGGVFIDKGVVVTSPYITSGTGNVSTLALTSLTIKGVAATINNSEITVELSDTAANSGKPAMTYTATNDAKVTMLDENGKVVPDNGVFATGTYTYTVKVEKDGYATAVYTLKVTVHAKNDDTSLKSVVVKGQTITADKDGNYTASLTYNVAYDATTVQLSVVPTDTNAKVAVSGGITEMDKPGVVTDGMTATITVTAEDGTQDTYTLTIKLVGNGVKVKVDTNNCKNAFVYINEKDTELTTVSNKDLELTTAIDKNYENLKVSYSIDGGKTWNEVTAVDGKYTLSSDVLAKAEAAKVDVLLKAEATAMPKLTVDAATNSNYFVYVNGERVTVPADGLYVKATDKVEVKVLSDSVSVKLMDKDKNQEIALELPTKDENGYFTYELPLTANTELVINGGNTNIAP